MSSADITDWANAHDWLAEEVDCVTALMLKIIDGKCKMNEADKAAAVVLYDAIGQRAGQCLDPVLHKLIAATRHGTDEAGRMRVYEERVMAEIRISRPVMKGFKGLLRDAAIFGRREDAAD
jgi:hypothetical protein